MKYKLVKEFPNEIIFEEKGPFVSIYLPTHRQLPERRQDIVLFKQLVKEVEKSLGTEYPPTESNKIMNALIDLENDKEFWDNTKKGMAVLATPKTCVVYLLNSTVEPLGVASDSFHFKPLIRINQNNEDYQILAISGKEYSVYQGDRYELKEIQLDPTVPRTIDDILGEEHTEKYTTQGTYGADGGSFFHGQGSKKDDIKQDLENFYRNIDKLVYENVSKTSELPLILANLSERHNQFMKVAKNPFLLQEAIDYSYDTHDLEGLKNKAWSIIEDLYKDSTARLNEKFELAKAKGMATDKLDEIVKSIAAKKVQTIILETDKVITGKLTDDLGNFELYEQSEHGVDDLLDDLAEQVIKQRGEVIVLSKDDMPTDTGIAVIFRF